MDWIEERYANRYQQRKLGMTKKEIMTEVRNSITRFVIVSGSIIIIFIMAAFMACIAINEIAKIWMIISLFFIGIILGISNGDTVIKILIGYLGLMMIFLLCADSFRSAIHPSELMQ